MSARLKRRLIKGFAAQGFSQVTTLLVQVFSVPLFLHYWGKVMYGEWLLLSSVLGYLSLSDLSFGNAAQNEMTMRVGRGDRQGALEVFQSAWLMVTGVSFTVMIVAMLCAQFAPFEHWLKLTRISHNEAVAVVDLLILQVVLAQQGGIFTAGYYCDGNYARGVMAGNLLRLSEFGASVAVILLGGRLWHVALAIFLTRLAGYGLIRLDLRRRSPWLALGRRYASLRVLRPLVLPALSFNAFPLGYAFSLQGVVTVIGVTLGPAAVTLFATSRTLTRLVWQMLAAVSNTVWVELSRAFGAGDLPLARSLHRRTCQIAFWGALISVGILFLIGDRIYRIWTRGRIPFDSTLFHLLLLTVICSSLWSTSYVVPMSINRHQKLALVFLCATGASMALAALFARSFGLNGVGVALLLAELVMNAFVIRRSLALLEDHFGDFIRIVLTPPLGWLRIRAADAIGRQNLLRS